MRSRSDDGVTLIFAIIAITVVSLLILVLLQQSFTNAAATVSSRAQGAHEYAADAAADWVTNQLRLTANDNPPAWCGTLGSASTETLPSTFYTSAFGAPTQTSMIKCQPDATSFAPVPCAIGHPCPNSSPGTALLTLDANSAEPGIYLSENAGDPVMVRGGIFSNSAINVAKGTLKDSWCPSAGCATTSPKSYAIARAHCLGTPIVMSQAGSTPTCDYGTRVAMPDTRGEDPQTLTPHAGSWDPPAIPAANSTISSCGGGAKYQTVTPGRFVGAEALKALNGFSNTFSANLLTGCTSGNVLFAPGVYYFDLPGRWTIPSKLTVVGGTPSSSGHDITKGSSTWSDYAGACVAPGDPAASANTGVEFVVGADSKFSVNDPSGNGSHLALCASNSADGPPMAIYGLKPTTAPAGTTADTSCTPAGTGSTGCAVLSTGNSPKDTLNVNGTTYLPRGVVSIQLNNSSTKLFSWGLITYAIEFSTTGSATLGNALVDVPDSAPTPVLAINRFYVQVFTCAGTAPCPTTGTPDIQLALQTQATTNNISVLSWSVNR